MAAPDAEVDPWGNNQLRQHLQKMWDRDPDKAKESKPEMKPKAHIVAGVHVSPSSAQYRQPAQPSQPSAQMKRPLGSRSRSPEAERDQEGSMAQLQQKPGPCKISTEVPRREAQPAEAKRKTVSPTATAVPAGAQRLSSTSERFVAGIPASRRLSFTHSPQLMRTMPPSIATAAALLSPRCEQRGAEALGPVGSRAPAQWFAGICASGALAPPHSPKSPMQLPKSPPTATGPALPAAVRSPSASHRTIHAVPVTHALASLPLRPRAVSPAPVQAWLPVHSRLSCRSLHSSASFAAANAFVVVSQN